MKHALRGMRPRRGLGLGGAALAAVVAVNAAPPAAPAAAVTYQTVALSGRGAPGTSLAYGFLDTPILNDAGQIAFFGALQGAGVTGSNDGVIYAGPAASPLLRAREGQAAPGTAAGVAYSFLEAPSLSNAGDVTFYAQLVGSSVTPGSNSSALYVDRGTGPQLAARTGSAAPGGGTYTQLGGRASTSPRAVPMNGAGELAVYARISDRSVVLAGPAANPRVVAREGDAAPGVGSTYLNFNSTDNLDTPVLAGGGAVAYLARLATGDQVVYTAATSADVPRVVARTNTPPPGANPLVVTWSLGSPVLTDGGRLAYFAELVGGSPEPVVRDALYVAAPGGTPQLVAETLNPAPGAGPGVRYGAFGRPNAPAINDAGGVAFVAGLTGGGLAAGDKALFAGPAAAPSMVARYGTAAPGAGGDLFEGFFQPDINDDGQVAFLASVREIPGISPPNDDELALYAYDPAAGLTLVVREGQRFDVGGGEFRTISTTDGIRFATGLGAEINSDRLSGLGEDGQLAFSLRFTDGTMGIFLATVPEPGMVGVIGVGAGVLLRRRRGRDRHAGS